MPSVTTADTQIRSSSGSPVSIPLGSHHHGQQPQQASRKSHDSRTSLGNAFLWTSDSNGENGHVDSSSDFILKSGSLQSLPTTATATTSTTTHTPTAGKTAGAGTYMDGTGASSHSRGRSSLSGSGEALAFREKYPSRENGNGVLRSSQDETASSSSFLHRSSLTNGVSMVNGNGHNVVSGTRSPSLRASGGPPPAGANGDLSSSEVGGGGKISLDLPPQTSMFPASTPTRADNVSQHTARQTSPSRSSIQPDLDRPVSPTTTTTPTTNPQSPHRHTRSTLQVPKVAPGRRSSQSGRDHPSLANASEDTLPTERWSSPATGIRRASLGLSRRLPRSSQSDIPPDEVPQDEDAARWTEAIKHRRASKRKRREDDDDERVMVGTKVDQHHVNWVTAYNMLTGIRFTVSRLNAKLDRELTDADFEAKHKFRFDITGNELTPSAKYDFKFKDYAPWVFRHLRAKFQLDPADYLVSLTSKYILSELGSPGKSGSFFYFSRDYKYIIKTIHPAEHKLLRKILREYYHHVEHNPNTLISQFYGLHRVKMAYGRKIHFVVMNNLFPPHRDIHHMFDLKGSTIGRDFREEDLDKNPRATLKDLNWLRRNRRLEFGPMKRDILLAQLRRDVTLLQKLHIMDYSLLIGIHDVNKGNEEKLRDRTLQIFQPGAELSQHRQSDLLLRTPSRLENARKARELREIIKREKPVPIEQTAAKMPDEILDERKNLVFYSDDGGFRATHESGENAGEIYYLGVIDCLTHYGMTKKAEHFWKGLSNNRSQISPIPPVGYGERFLNFITGITKSQEEVDREKVSQSQSIPPEVQQQQPPIEARLSGVISDPLSRTESHPSGSGQQRDSVDKTMEKAEKEAAKSAKTLPEDPEPRERVMTTVRAPSSEIQGPSTLPVVEEIGEAGSNSAGDKSGGQSARSRSGTGNTTNTNGDVRPTPVRKTSNQSFRTATAPPGPPPDTLPPPPPAPPESPHRKGKMKAREVVGLDEKSLPTIPTDHPVSGTSNDIFFNPPSYPPPPPPKQR